MATYITVTILIWPKIKAYRKQIRDIVIQERRPLSQEEKRNIENKIKKDVEAEIDTEGQKELMSELIHGDLKDLFKPGQKE